MSDTQPSPDFLKGLGTAVHYAALDRGVPIYGCDEAEVGTLDHIMDNYAERILDGLVIREGDGTIRFVDAPEVAHTFERGVVLSIDAAAVAQLGPPEENPGVFGANKSSGLGKRFGSAWKKR